MAVWPPSSPAGTTAVSSVDEADVRRAVSPPIVTRGSVGSTGRPVPSIVTEPPSTAQSGWTAEIRDELEAVIEWRSTENPSVGTRRAGAVSALVELHIPVEIVAPAVRGVFEANRDPDCRRPFRTSRHAYQVHTGFGRRAAPLLPIAADTAGNDVLPVFAAALGDRHDMIEGQVRRGEHLTAVLAGV